ncbi:LpqB family beta-propeller domain-containing protein [Streptomyces polyrhachis]|uniref:LpqB family beta-propeller domain-containing protein n=1 Tax=Streptomyces polyrhachis TaxID=1282885 RepID=A0ABW2GCV1_9ACTN
MGGLGGRKLRQAIAAAGVGVVLAGCAGMPDSGGVSAVEKTDKQGPRYARTVPVAPKPGADAQQIVKGFLETLRSDDGNYATARQYLTEATRKGWRPPTRTTVLAAAPVTSTGKMSQKERQVPEGERQTRRYLLGGQQIATLDAQTGAYQPDVAEFRNSVLVVKEKDEWRIAQPPSAGLVLSKSDFTRTYGPAVNTYYFTDRAADALVASPVYVRDQQVDPGGAMTQAVRALLTGWSGLPSGIAHSAFPDGTRLGGADAVELDGRLLTVRLRLGEAVNAATCRRMAAQVWYTVRNQFAPRLSEVRLWADGEQRCALRTEGAERYASEQLTKTDGHGWFYYVDDGHRLMRAPVAKGERRPEAVPGPFAEGKVKIRSVAVARSEGLVAAVTTGGRELYTTGVSGSAVLGEPLLRSRAGQGGGGGDAGDLGLTTPSWDGLGDLWVADRTASATTLYWSSDGLGEPRAVEVAGLGDGRIQALRVAAEGARIAMLVEGDGRTRLMLGGITRSGDTLRVGGLTEIAPQLEEVQSVSWAGDSRLAVVGRVEDGVDQVIFVETDGRQPEIRARELTGVSAVAASEAVTMPLVAISAQAGVVRLPVGADWEKVAPGGVAPVYPG